MEHQLMEKRSFVYPIERRIFNKIWILCLIIIYQDLEYIDILLPRSLY